MQATAVTNPSPSPRQPAAVLSFACLAAHERGAEVEAALTPADAAARPAAPLTGLTRLDVRDYASGGRLIRYRVAGTTTLQVYVAPGGRTERPTVATAGAGWATTSSALRARIFAAVRRDAGRRRDAAGRRPA